jgi:hypothetical protein
MRSLLFVLAMLLGSGLYARAQGNGAPIGDLELPEYGATVSGLVNVSGWALDFEDETLTVVVVLDGQQVGLALYCSGDRPDIQDAFPDVEWSLHTGFAYSLDTRSYPNGPHRIRVTATDPHGLATVIGEVAVSFDNSQQPAVRPWPDTTDGVYVISGSLPSSLTNEQVGFAATHYAGCCGITRSLADRLRSRNRDFLALHERYGLGLGYREPDAEGRPLGAYLTVIEGNSAVREWPDAPQDQWFYPYGGSARVYQNRRGWYLTDTDNASWQAYWLDEVGRQMQANDDDGLLADSLVVPSFIGASAFTPNLPEGDPVFESTWSGKITRWIAGIKQQFGTSRKLIANVGNWITARDMLDYSGADGVLVDGFAAWGGGLSYSQSDWQLQMDRVLGLASQGKIVIARNYISSQSDLAFRKFLLANYLLVKGTKSFLDIELGDQPEWFPEYGVDLGPPLSAAPRQVSELYRADWGVYARQYARGLVLVNPANITRTIDVGGGYAAFEAVGGGVVPASADVREWHLNLSSATSVVLPPRTAEVLLTDVTAPPALAVTPDIAFSAVGTRGGPFSPKSLSYTLTNTGGLPVTWIATLTKSSQWLSINPSTGTLGVAGQATLTVSLTSAADTLLPGVYSNTLSIANVTNGIGSVSRAISLQVASGAVTGSIDIVPLSGILASGPAGGPFLPGSTLYSVYNPGDTPVQCAVTHDVGENWLSISQLISPGQTAQVAVVVNESAKSLAPGGYADTVRFTNATNGQGDTSRSVALSVLGGQLTVTPAGGFSSAGSYGGPFSPATRDYTISNTGAAPLAWSARHGATSEWLSLTPTSGVLGPGDSVTVTASITSAASTLTGGTYTDTISFVNTTDNAGSTTRLVQLNVYDGRLQVTPSTGLAAGGSPGGPFAPASQVFTLFNPGNSSIGWSISHDAAVKWLDISQTSGTLASGTSGSVIISLNAAAAGLPAGTYGDTLVFTNTTNGAGSTTRPVSLVIVSHSLAGLDLLPSSLQCPSTDARQIRATVRFSDGTTEDVTSVAQWSSSNPSVATVDAGLVVPRSQGSTTVACSYSLGGLTRSATCPVTVRYSTFYYLYLTPQSHTFYDNAPYRFQCWARLASGWIDITEACSWITSDSKVAVVDQRGFVTPAGNGMATVRAAYVINGVTKTIQGSVDVRSW